MEENFGVLYHRVISQKFHKKSDQVIKLAMGGGQGLSGHGTGTQSDYNSLIRPMVEKCPVDGGKVMRQF